jgi:hypothetical protein
LEINPWIINVDRIITKMEKSRVLVLGATGYIGKYIHCKGKGSIASSHFYSSSTSHFELFQKGAT